jgi:hypothetical protein
MWMIRQFSLKDMFVDRIKNAVRDRVAFVMPLQSGRRPRNSHLIP